MVVDDHPMWREAVARDLAAVKAGATGYLLKSAAREEFLDAVRRTAAGDAVFTPGLAGLVLGEYRRRPPPPPPPHAPRGTPRPTGGVRGGGRPARRCRPAGCPPAPAAPCSRRSERRRRTRRGSPPTGRPAAPRHPG